MTLAREETARVLRIYEHRAAEYDRRIARTERLLFADGREWACAQARGEVLEIAVGTGRNLLYYPDEVTLVGIELSPAMLRIARGRAADHGRSVDLRVGDAQALDFADDRFDTVVCTLALCTMPDARAAVAEVRRVLRPGGRFVLLEHVRSSHRAARLGQRLLEPLFVRFGGDHLLRDPLEHLLSEEFSIEQHERSRLGIVERVVATRPPPNSRHAVSPSQAAP